MKLVVCFKRRIDALVTPRAGVWIETQVVPRSPHPKKVTPRAGVWIETTAIGGPERG